MVDQSPGVTTAVSRSALRDYVAKWPYSGAAGPRSSIPFGALLGVPPAITRQDNRPLRGLRILLLEDVRLTRRAISLGLQYAGAEVVEVDSAEAARQEIKEGGIDAGVLDLNLPSSSPNAPLKDGVAVVAAALRAGIPVVVATVYTLQQFVDAARAQRISESRLARVVYINKPFNRRELLKAVRLVVEAEGGTVQ